MWIIQRSGEHGIVATNTNGRLFEGTAAEYRTMLDKDRAVEEIPTEEGLQQYTLEE